jgi:intracellular multiplication protein IcmW
MESVENFTLDGTPALETVIDKIGDTLESLMTFDLGKEDQFIALCAHLKSSRILRILQAIDTIDPGSASKLLMFAEENNTPDNPLAGFFLRRNIAFERLRLLSRVFSADRLVLMLKVLEQDG